MGANFPTIHLVLIHVIAEAVKKEHMSPRPLRRGRWLVSPPAHARVLGQGMKTISACARANMKIKVVVHVCECKRVAVTMNL